MSNSRDVVGLQRAAVPFRLTIVHAESPIHQLGDAVLPCLRSDHRVTGKTNRENGDVRISAAWALTPAECRIVRSLASGLGTVEIAHACGLSVHTVRTHLKRAMTKAGVHSQAALVARVYASRG